MAPHRTPLDLLTAGALSVAGHAVAAFALVGLVQLGRLHLWERPAEEITKQLLPAVDEAIEIEIEEAPRPSPLTAEQPPVTAPQAVSLGGSKVARADQRHPGRGGDDQVAEQALNLADQDDGITRDPSTFSNPKVSQLSRILTKRDRRSYENFRAGREPMELTFVAMGTRGVAEERRQEAMIDPASGLRVATQRSLYGGALGSDQARGDSERLEVVGTHELGSNRPSLGAGYAGSRANGAESSAVMNAFARPDSFKGDPSVPATDEGKAGDTVESEQAVSDRMLALMHASTLGGSKRGQGKGGEGGGGAPGAGGAKGAGQSASPLGAGGSGPGDVERVGYIRGVQSKVHPLWANAFPKWAIAQGLAGTATIAFTVEADGSVSSARVARTSGIPEFDENVRKAVLKGAPYGALPELLKPRLSMSLSFNAANPAVRPKNFKDGASD